MYIVFLFWKIPQHYFLRFKFSVTIEFQYEFVLISIVFFFRAISFLWDLIFSTSALLSNSISFLLRIRKFRWNRWRGLNEMSSSGRMEELRVKLALFWSSSPYSLLEVINQSKLQYELDDIVSSYLFLYINWNLENIKH